jgi:lysophospholipase L1-like esterase
LRYALDMLRELSQANGFMVLGMIIPILDGTPENADVYRAIDEIVSEEFKRQGFSAISMSSEFSAAGLDRLMRWSDDLLHPNARGHQLMAERLFQEVRRLRVERHR